jgi:hypothetical protein
VLARVGIPKTRNHSFPEIGREFSCIGVFAGQSRSVKVGKGIVAVFLLLSEFLRRECRVSRHPLETEHHAGKGKYRFYR